MSGLHRMRAMLRVRVGVIRRRPRVQSLLLQTYSSARRKPGTESIRDHERE